MANKRLVVIIGLFISALFLYLAFRGLQPDAFFSTLQEANPLLIGIAALAYFPALLAISWRWQFLVRAIRDVPLGPLAQIVAIGYMGNNVYPLRAGEALRVFLLKRNHQFPVTRSVTTIVVERIFDGIILLSFILIGLSALPNSPAEVQTVVNVAGPVFGVAFVLFLVLASQPTRARQILRLLAQPLPQRLADLLLGLSDEVLEGLAGLRSPLSLLGVVVATYLSWVIQAGVHWIVLEAFGISLAFGVSLLVVGTVNLAGLIPASPGQIGVWEFFTVAVLMAAGIGQDQALAYAIIVHIVIWLPVTVVGFIFLAREGLGWAAIARARELEAQAAASS